MSSISPEIPVSTADFEIITASLLGQRLSRPWSGAGTVLFAEVGRLRRIAAGSRLTKGTHRIGFGYDWRVEGPTYLAFESSNPKVQLKRDIQSLKGLVIEHIALVGQIPELVVKLTCGLSVWTLSRDSRPTWSIHLSDDTWLGVTRGLLVRNTKAH